MDIKEYILSAVKDFKIELSEEQLSQLETYYKLLVSWNEKMNLTAIIEPKDVAIKHFADSLSVMLIFRTMRVLLTSERERGSRAWY